VDRNDAAVDAGSERLGEAVQWKWARGRIRSVSEAIPRRIEIDTALRKTKVGENQTEISIGKRDLGESYRSSGRR
jgi:hypothetical protein